LNRVGTRNLMEIFLRSLSIYSSWSYSGMQNIGFAYSLIPLIKKMGADKKRAANILKRHAQLFNTHPYLATPIIGSVVRLEEESCESDDCPEAVNLKKTLMAPYAALGDPFFWGALRPSLAIVGTILALRGLLVAPLVFLLMYNSVHLWIRVKGFIEAYRDGKGAVDFLRGINMPERTKRIKWFSVVLLAILTVTVIKIPSFSILGIPGIFAAFLVLVSILFFYWLIRKGVSPLIILYGSPFVFIAVTI
jgi:PTS system mannose-specific IID component